MPAEKMPIGRRILQKAGFLFFGLVLALLFALAVILGTPQEVTDEMKEKQMLQPASPAVTFTPDADLQELRAAFPTTVLLCTTDDLSLVEGTSFDTAYEDGFARILRLVYENTEGARFTVTSIYPQRAITLLADDALTMQGKGLDIAGYTSAEMTGNGRIRLHIQTDRGLYSVESALEHNDHMPEILKKLQLID